MSPTKTQRWLDLLILLLGRRQVLAVEEIMTRVPAYAEKWNTGDKTDEDSARRAFERDKQELLELGIPITATKQSRNYGAEIVEGYCLEYDEFYLPYIRLLSDSGEPEPAPTAQAAGASGAAAKRTKKYRGVPSVDFTSAEVALALDALRRIELLPASPFATDARSALRKLSFDFDVGLFPDAPIVWVDHSGHPGREEVAERVRTLTDALERRKKVTFSYYGITRNATSTRTVAPYGIYFQRQWYLVGDDGSGAEPKSFRMSRMNDLKLNTKAPQTPDYAIPEDFVLHSYLGRSPWQLGPKETVRAEVRFTFPRALIVARNREGELVRTEEDGAMVRAFDVANEVRFVRWILSFGGDAEILSPPDFREALESVASQVEELYREETDHG